MKFRYLLEAKTDSLYPEFEMLDNKVLYKSYDYFNKKLFASKLPECRIKFNALAKNFYGKAHCKYDVSQHKIKDLLITISDKIKTDHKKVYDTLIHEMIHIWQYKMNESEKTFKYSEASWAEIMASKDKHTYGHNKYFIEMMNKFNSIGYEIDIASDAPIGTELEKEVYGIVFHNDSDVSVMIWSPDDISKNEEKVVNNILDKKGNIYKDYFIFKTKESNIILTTRLTKTFDLPKNIINIEFLNSFVDDIVNSPLSTVILNKGIDSEKNITSNSNKAQNEIINMLSITAKFRNSSFSSYFKTVWLNAFPEWGKIKGTELYSEGKTFKGENVPNGLTIESCEAIYNFWMNISNAELKRTKEFSYFATSYIYDNTMKKDKSNTFKNLKSYFDDFKDRVSEKDFIDAVMVVTLKEMEKKLKKYGKDEIEKTLNGFKILMKKDFEQFWSK